MHSPTIPAERGKADLLALGGASFASSAALRLCDAMLPALAGEFAVSLAEAAWTTSAYALAYGLLQLAYGPLADRYGKWRVVTLATLGCVVGNAMAAFAPTLAWLIGARALGGATAAALIPLSMAVIGDRVPLARRQVVLARFLTATIAGMVAGQWLSGLLADTLGWRWAFGLFALLFAVVGGYMYVRPAAAEPLAHAGDARLSASVARVLHFARAREVLVVTVLHASISFACITFVPAFLHERFGLSLRAAAGVVVLYGVGGLAYSWLASAAIERRGPAWLVRVGGALLAVSYLGFAWAPSWPWTTVLCLLAGLAYYAMQSLLNMSATTMADAALRGTALSLFAGSLFGGIALGVALGAAAIAWAGYEPVFAGCAVLMLGLSLAWSRRLAGRR